LCDFSASFVDQIWNHKLDQHTGEYFNVKTFDENERKNMLFSLVAEQNVELMEEIIKLKDCMKEVLEGFAHDVEDHLNDLKKDAKKQNIGTANALSILTREVIKLQESTVKEAETSPTSAPPTSSSASTDPKASKIPSYVPPPASKESKTKVKAKMPAEQKNHTKRKTVYQQKPKVLIVGDSLAHNSHFRKLEIVTNTTIKTAKGYSSVWDKDARYKHLNITDVTKNELEKDQFDHIVLAAPTVDITNLGTVNTKPGDDMERLKEKVRASCLNMFNVAENALDDNTLKNVILMNHAPRYDTASKDPMGIKHNLDQDILLTLQTAICWNCGLHLHAKTTSLLVNINLILLLKQEYLDKRMSTVAGMMVSTTMAVLAVRHTQKVF
jgi:hypothetical protein